MCFFFLPEVCLGGKSLSLGTDFNHFLFMRHTIISICLALLSLTARGQAAPAATGQGAQGNAPGKSPDITFAWLSDVHLNSFAYAEDDLRAVYDHDYKWLVDFNVALHGMVVDFLDLPITAAVADCAAMSSSCAIDLRGRIGGKKHDADDGIVDVPYYSVWDERHGFVPSLSIIDLLMNCGREAVFVLHKMLNGILI